MINLANLKTPGVYVDEIALLPPSVVGVETSIPAFIGYTEKAQEKTPGDLNLKPQKIRSLREYETFFGRVNEGDITVAISDETDSADVLQRRSLSISVTPALRNMYYHMQMFFSNGGSTCYIVSVGQGSPDTAPVVTDLENGLKEVEKLDEPTLLVFPDATGIVAQSAICNLYKKALAQAGELKDRFVIMDVKDVVEFRQHIGTENLKYGASYYPALQTQLTYVYADGDVYVTHQVSKAGAAATQGIYDQKKLSEIPSTGALYNAIKQGISEEVPTLYPSATVAGAYAAVDAARGVWKAPANVGMVNVLGPSVMINDQDQQELNVDVNGGISINAIRNITGRGTVIWGARTLAGNDNEWRYVSVRRFFNYVEESVKKATYRFVFEPNDANTWVSIRAMIENFLILQWRAGALQGAKPEQAFFVRVGLGSTMTADDILNGRLIIEIGMAVVRPAEFIVLRFMHKLPE